MQSLDSREFVKTQFSWQYYYYTLTPAGLDYLREWLHLPAEIVPQTHIKQQRTHAPPRGLGGDDRERRGGGRGGRGGDRGEYRRRDQGEGKEGGAPGDFNPSFRGGFGKDFRVFVIFKFILLTNIYRAWTWWCSSFLNPLLTTFPCTPTSEE
jgi:small subunit ribosomal protein S10e